jgi:hypothetical protein
MLMKTCALLKKFSLPPDETTDMSRKSQLISFPRSVVETQIIRMLLFCRELEAT